jgi:hypothetical protein
MVDSPNYANSPLANPNFLNRVAPAPTADPGFAPMAPGIIDRAVAQEPVFQAKTLEERKRELEIEQVSLRNRSAGEIISDSLLTGANAAASGVVPIAGLVLKGVGAATEYLAPDGSVAQDVGGLINDRAMIQASEVTNGISDLTSLGKSDVALRSAQIDGQIAQVNDEINLNQYEEDLAGGDNEFIASLSLYGRQAMDFTDRMSDPVAALDLTANALGSVASGSILPKIGSKIATSVAERFGMEGVKKLGLEYGGSALGMGVTEASSTYVGTVDEVMRRTSEEMASSEMYRKLTAQGMGHDEAQAKVADSAGMDVFVNQLPAAMAAGLLSAKFNANPLSVMRGENPLGVFITAGKEALEETAQGASGQFNQNKAIRDYVDPNQALDEGVIDQAVGGLLGGFAASGIIGAPSGVRNGLQEQADRISEKVANERFVQGMGEQIAAQRHMDARNAMTPEQRDADLGAGMAQTSPAEDLFNSVVNKGAQVVDAVKNVASAVDQSETANKVVDTLVSAVETVRDSGIVNTVKAGVQSVKEAATPIINKVIKAAQDYNEQGNPVVQNETVAAAESVVADALDPAVETGNLGTPDTTITKKSLPDIFKDNVPESASLAETMTNIVKTIAEKKIPISSMTDDAILFVTQKFNDMQNAASTLAPEVQSKIKKVLASPDLERIRKRAARLDLNTAVSSTIEKVSSTVKAMTVAMSKINPTNVNPDVVDKILKQEDRGDLTPKDIQDMEVAASVSRPMNQLINNIVKIEDDRNAFLVSTGAKPETEDNSFERVSRRLIEGDPTNQEKLPSIKKSVNQIILGMRSPDKAVDVDGVRVPVDQVITRFKNLTQHMINKVTALNESFDQNDEKGVGPTINFPTLSSKTGKFIPVGQVGSGNAVYNKRSIKSTTFAKTVGADAAMLVEVHNALVKAYPDQFPNGPITLPVLKTQESNDTTAVEEVSAAVGTDENAQTTQDVTPAETPETKAVEDATPVASEAIVLGLTQEKTDAMADEAPESVPEVQPESKVSDRFISVFRPKKNTKRLAAKEILDRIAEKDGTETYREFATILMGRISAAMNDRLQTVLLSKSDGRSVAQALKEDQTTILEYTKIKPLMIVDSETGRYNQELLDLASMAVIDWMTTARAYGAGRLDDMLKELGLTYDDVPDEQIQDLLNSVPTRTTSEGLAKKLIKLWGVQVNKDAQMVDIRGTTEGLVKEIFTVLSQMEDPLVRIIELKTGEGRTASFEISNLKGEQEAIGLNAAGSLDKVLFPEDQIQASFGEKIAYVPKSQNNKADVSLSNLEQKAIKKMQDTAHTEALPVVNFFAALGLDAWSMMAGKKDSSALGKRHPLRLTIEGKNTSIERDFETAFQMVTAAAGRPVFYPVSVTNVGRHQMKGINPQNNKLLRAMITPTHSKLNMESNQKHKNAFWLTVAQSSGLAKVEKRMHTKILSTIQEDFAAKFGEATGLALAFLETGTLDTQGFAAAMLKANGGEDVSAAQINAVLAVARLQQAQRKNDPSHLESFETSLSFELDGKTDGPANMMVAFGQGIMTRMEYQNFKRVGLFLGSKGETLNSLFSGGEVDLYEVNSTFADIRMMDMINSSTGMDKKRLMALQRFAARFGDFVINPDGTIQMSRATSKNPMTKKVYGSGENGIAEGIAQDMLVGFYTKLISMADGVSVEDHLNYQEINQDLDLLFGVKLPDVLDVNNFILPNTKMKPFAEFVKETIGTILSESINQVMSEKTTGVNDLLVFSTGVQGQFMKLLFDQRLAEAVAEAKIEWEATGNTATFSLHKLSQAAYDAVVKETLAFAPYFSDGLQNLRIGDFTGQQDKTELSSNLSGNVRAKSTMQKPDDMGVKAIPYVIQGRGDAMMMNRIFGADNAPERAIPIFDGIDMAITDFTDLADQINEAVLSNWDHDVLGPIVSNFDVFLARVEEQGLGDKLQAAFSIVRKDSKDKTSVTALDPSQLAGALAEVHRLNQARKAVFKRITLAVDHMGGSGQAYIRNYDGKDLTFEEINAMIQDELDGIAPAQDPALTAPEVDRFAGVEDAEIIEDGESVVVTDVATVVEALIRETKPHLREVIRAIRGMLPDGARIVMGTEEQIAQWRKDNLGQNQSKKLDQKTKGFYDVDNNVIFIMSDNHETMVHEMVHMATFQAVLDHYEGTQKSTAVKNLEILMEEFLALDTTTMSKEAQEAYFDVKRAIIKAQAEASPMGDAVALNEFMAWTLASPVLMVELKQTPTALITRLTKVAKAWIQRILGVVPLDMYSHILFNTEMIRNNDGFENDGTPPVPPTSTAGVTPPADAFTNFWIDRLRDALEASKTPDGKGTQDKLIRYIATADDALVKLDFGGFSLSEYQKKTFVAIHAVIAAELRLDANALIALGKVYEHVTNNLTPQMFGTGQAAQDRYSAIMELMGATKNDEGISDAIAVLLALSQTSNGFRTAMDQVPQPAAQPGIQNNSLNDLLTSTTGFLMQKLIATTDTEGKGVKEILDSLSDQILRQDNQNEFRALKGLMATFDKADAFVGGALSLLAQKTRDFNRDVQASQTNGILKVVSGSVALATAFMDKNTSAMAGKGAKAATHMDGMLDGAIFIRELVAEIVGADAVNSDTIQMLDKVTYVVQSTRQAYREELPVVLQNEFTTHPDAKQWKALHWVLGKTDFASLFDLTNPDDSFDMLNDQTLLDRRIKTREAKIMKAFPGQDGKNILEKAQQLADYMNDKGAGFQLMKNAYAIHKLAVGQKNKPNFVNDIDKLVSLYALNGTDIAQREAVAAMQASDPNGVHNLLVYVQALNKEEDQKTITEAARINGYKGYIPDHGQGEVSLIIAKDSDREDLQKRGYVRVADDTTDSVSLISRGYYVTTVKQSGNYSQGVLQQVQDTYRGVNAVTGLTANGTTSGVIAGVAVVTITDALNQSLRVADPKNVLLPVYDEDGGVLYYERGINPDLREKYLQPESNMALMTGVWAGRQVEEKFSHEYNKALVQRLKEIWDNRELGTDGLFVRMDQAKDKIYAESWGVIPPQLKEHILETFGEDTGFMVRKDMINLALGYRDPSIVDVWSGNHRLPESMELAIKTVGKFTMGDKAYKWLANSESLTMNTISTAKDFIVVRSLVVPFMNTQSNVFQLVNRGVGTRQIMRGYKEKFAEIEKLNQNLKKIMGLQARVRLAATDKNKVAILKQQIQVLEDENERFSVSPLVKEGAYKNISEGITDLDVSITDGKFGDWVESQLNRLPGGVKTVAKYGLLSKDTALYKGANKAVQYGDFVAKSIYYDDLKAKGLNHDQAMVKVNEEFINFSLLPGRTRTYLESMGATWFLTFKIRSMKVALQMMRENPVRSLAAVGVFGLDSGPVTDNVATKALEGTLPYSLGWDMLFDAPGMIPWLNITNG